jgi:hypothetical protein
MIVTDALARRLEAAEAIDAAGCAEAACKVDSDCDPVVRGIAGGVIVFCGAASPLTHALGVGMHGSVTEEEIAEIELFFFSRGAGVALDVCPHADATLREVLVSRGYRLAEMNNVLVRALGPGEHWPVDLQIEPAADSTEYAQTVTCGFFGRDLVTDDEIRLGKTLFHMPNATPLIARSAGQATGACGLSVRNGVASFYGDATLNSSRNRGVHSAMIAFRLNSAVTAGCDLATAGTQPGSVSQRNYQRFGFEVAYTKATMVLPAP